MNYVGHVIRPPSEADSIILQVTVGCSYNKCTFCGAYKDIPFQVKSEETILADLEYAKVHHRDRKRLFLADGDALILSQKRLLQLFKLIHLHLPWVSRISLYGNARAIRNKSAQQLKELKSLGLTRIYMGLESGCDEVLQKVKKGETGGTMVAAGRRIRECGIFLSVTTLLGPGEKSLSVKHAIDTSRVLTEMRPNQVAALTLMPLDNTELGRKVATGNFTILSAEEILLELHQLITGLQDLKCQFHANHASNFLPLSGRLPRDKAAFLTAIEMAMEGATPLVPEYMRAL